MDVKPDNVQNVLIFFQSSSFLPRDAMHSVVLVIVKLSVRPSVCLTKHIYQKLIYLNI